jgi:hypothetical protein
MATALLPRPGWRGPASCPDTVLRWQGFRVEPAAAEALREICGLDEDTSSTRFGLLYPQVTGFRLVMAVLTQRAWPLPIWNALQVRNRIFLHAPLSLGDEYKLEARPSGWRILARGLEIDLHARLTRGEDCRWESVVTFYYRGRHGEESRAGDELGAPTSSPAVGEEESRSCTQWNTGDGGRWRFGRLTGDYNPLHQWDAYARRMGFPAAFAHPQRVLGQCLARLPDPGRPAVRLDLWIKGPVPFGRAVTLRHDQATRGGRGRFGLWLEGDARPALVGALA